MTMLAPALRPPAGRRRLSRTGLAAALVLALTGGTSAMAASALDFTVRDIDGADVPLSRYRGQVVLIVNVASKCGFTPQYAELQTLYETYSAKGLVVLGFPANDFLWQEPGSEAEIKQFCSTRYQVTFPMFAKVVVKGDDACPLYRFLTGRDTDPDHAGAISWNFNKFLLDRQGRVVNRFGSRTKPLAAEVVAAVEKALAETPQPAAPAP